MRSNSVAVQIKQARTSGRHNRAISFDEVTGQKPAGVACELKLLSVDDVNETFQVACLIHTHYRTSEVQPDKSAHNEFVREDDFKGFRPEIVVTNVVQQQYLDWHVTTRINRYTGDVWTSYNNLFNINESLELQKFPFDMQLFRVQFKSPNAALDLWQLPVDILDFPAASDPVMDQAPYVLSSELNQWSVIGIEVGLHGDDPDPVSLTKGEFKITIKAERDPLYYLKNFSFVLFLIVLGNLACMGVSPSSTSDRMNITIVLLLTAVAFKFVLTSSLPKVGYSTLQDKYVLSAFVFLMFGIMENILVSDRVRCLPISLRYGNSVQCLAEQNDEETLNWVIMMDAYFSLVYGVAWIGLFFALTLVSYVPRLIRPSWAYVVKNQVGDVESTIKRALLVEDLDGEYEGSFRRPNPPTL